MYQIQLENLTTIYMEDLPVTWPTEASANLFSIILQKNKISLGDFLKMCMKQSRKYEIGITWPDFCVLAAKQYSIVKKVQRPDIWKDRMFILSLLSSFL